MAADNGGEVEMQTGQTLIVTLDSNPGTGYAWEVVEFDAALLPMVGEAVYKSESDQDPLLGRGGTETFRFDAQASGVVRLHLIYHRPWEKDVPPLDAFILEVIIR